MVAGGREEGAALLAVLLLVAVMAALSVVALDRLRLATRLSANAGAVDQARAFALGAEALAAARVSALAKPDVPAALAAGWQGRLLRLPVPGGLVTARLRDGGNCFNLNSVAEGAVPTELASRPVGISQFVALMRVLGIADRDATRVAAGLADWVDADAVPNLGGAEDDAYTRGATPHRTANTLVADVSELRAVAGVTPGIYATLRPWICALPTADLSPLNVNTLVPDQAPLVAMLIPDQLNLARARQIIVERPAAGWESPAAFWRLPALEALVPPAEVQGQPQVRTRWFGLDLDVQMAGAQVTETALIDGSLTPGKVVARSWGDDE